MSVKIKCKKCGAVLESTHRHDFVYCDCENHAFLDGGGDPYIRFGAEDFNDLIFYDNEGNETSYEEFIRENDKV